MEAGRRARRGGRALNLIGATLVGASPLFLRYYLAYLSDYHRAVMFNRAELNYEMTSWNRLLFIATRSFAGEQFLIEQTAQTTVAAYLVWFGLVLGRCAISGTKPSAAWAGRRRGRARCGAPRYSVTNR